MSIFGIRLLLLSTFLIMGNAFCGTMYSFGPTNMYDYVITLSVGPTWNNAGTSQSIFLLPDLQKHYEASKTYNSLFNGEFFIGTQGQLSSIIGAQLGLAFAASTNATLHGAIWEDADPEFNDFLYSYQVSHSQVTVKTKFFAIDVCSVEPYISASIGAGFNKAFNFEIQPLIFEQLPAPPFGSNKTTSFAYTLGFGIQKAVFSDWVLGIGYEFGDWGQSQLARANGQTVNEGPLLNNFYTQQLQFSVSLLA